EVKMCQKVQNGMYDFLMANKVAMKHKLVTKREGTTLEIAPFVMLRRYSPINNKFWKAVNGQEGSEEGLWQLDITGMNDIPMDLRWLNVDTVIYVDGQTGGGTSTKTAWKILAATLVTVDSIEYVRVDLESQNTGSFLDEDRLEPPVTGLVFRGGPNKSDYEKFCAEAPALINWHNEPSWVQTTRTAFCKSQQYDEYRAQLLGAYGNNTLFREFGDLPDAQRNQQLASDFQNVWTHMFWFQKPISSNQTI